MNLCRHSLGCLFLKIYFRASQLHLLSLIYELFVHVTLNCTADTVKVCNVSQRSVCLFETTFQMLFPSRQESTHITEIHVLFFPLIIYKLQIKGRSSYFWEFDWFYWWEIEGQCDLARFGKKDFISSWLRLEKCSVNSHLMTEDAKSRELKRVKPGSHCEFLVL